MTPSGISASRIGPMCPQQLLAPVSTALATGLCTRRPLTFRSRGVGSGLSTPSAKFQILVTRTGVSAQVALRYRDRAVSRGNPS
jgi:hypothetical protein